MLEQAGLTKVDQTDEDLVEYLNSLREGILEAYTGVVQGLKDGQKAQLLYTAKDVRSLPIAKIFTFLDLLAQDVEKRLCDDVVIQHAVGLIGDLADVTPRGPFSEQFKSPSIVVLMRAKRDHDIFKYAKAKIDANHVF